MFSKFRRKEDGAMNPSDNLSPLANGGNIITSPNPISPTYNMHLENRLRHDSPIQQNGSSQSRFSKYPSHTTQPKKSYGAGFDQNSTEYKIVVWLQSHNVWFNDKTGNQLMSVLIESGITEPDTELKLLKEWPDLIQIAEAAVKSTFSSYHIIIIQSHIMCFLNMNK